MKLSQLGNVPALSGWPTVKNHWKSQLTRNLNEKCQSRLFSNQYKVIFEIRLIKQEHPQVHKYQAEFCT